MIGIILLAHSPLATSMKSVLECIIGEELDIGVLDVLPSDDIDQMRQALADKVIASNDGQGVVIITDIYGGVPSNLAASVVNDKVRMLSGMNVPMLLKLFRMRNRNLDEAIHASIAAGTSFIIHAEKEGG